MRMRLFGLLLAGVVMAALPVGAAADPVVVLSPHGHAVVRDDPYVTGPALTPAPASGEARASAAAGKRRPRKKRRRPGRTVTGELQRLTRSGAISSATARGDLAAWNGALATERRLRGTRRTELTAVTRTLHSVAAAKLLTPSRSSSRCSARSPRPTGSTPRGPRNTRRCALCSTR